MGVKSVPLNVSFINISSMETKNIQNPIIPTGLKKGSKSQAALSFQSV